MSLPGRVPTTALAAIGGAGIEELQEHRDYLCRYTLPQVQRHQSPQ